MKNGILNVVLLLTCTLFLTSCSTSDYDNNVLKNVDATEVKAIVESGQWQIKYYFDDKDETADYNGYEFAFTSDGVLTATNGETSFNGTWSIADSDSNDDSSDGSVEFIIYFPTPDILEELSDDWDILSFSNTKMELKDVSGGDGSTDVLTLEKM